MSTSSLKDKQAIISAVCQRHTPLSQQLVLKKHTNQDMTQQQRSSGGAAARSQKKAKHDSASGT
jgi:hypothetical protein